LTEKDFTRDLIRGLTAQGVYAEKWPDLARAVTKPFDICACHDNQFWPIECKLRQFHGKEQLPGRTVIVSPADFRGRQHQLPRLLRMCKARQGFPYIAAFIALHREHKQPLKRGWLIPVLYFEDQDTFTFADLTGRKDNWELAWEPNIGWICPWLARPDAALLPEDE
jgi:hypothetical protein